MAPYRVQGFKVSEITYHRNGISGRAFHSVRFTFDHDGRVMKMTAVLPLEAKHDGGDVECFVLSEENPTANFRGDNFIGLVRDAVIEHERKSDELYREKVKNFRLSSSKMKVSR